MRRILALTLLAGTVVACRGGTATLEIADARVGVPAGPNAAAYLTVTSPRPDRLIGAGTDRAAGIELHETIMEADGSMMMSPVSAFPVDDGQPLVLEPGGKHLMLLEADRLEVGDEVEITLIFEEAGEVTVTAPVVEAHAVMDGTDG